MTDFELSFGEQTTKEAFQSVPMMIQKRTRGVPEVCQSVPEQLMALIKVNPSISRDELSKQLNISVRQVRKIINQFKNDGVLTREGGDSGRWIINKI